MLSTQSIIVASSDQVSVDMDGEMVMLSMKDGVYYGLNPMGTCIWKLIQEPQAVSQVIDVLLAEYEVDRARCEKEVFALLHDLESHGLIEIRNTPHA